MGDAGLKTGVPTRGWRCAILVAGCAMRGVAMGVSPAVRAMLASSPGGGLKTGAPSAWVARAILVAGCAMRGVAMGVSPAVRAMPV